MAVKQLGDLFEHGVDILGTTQDGKGTILAQTGDVIGEFVKSESVELWGLIGFASRPARAVSGKDAAQAISINRGSNDLIIGFRDVRFNPGPLKEGETVIFAPGPSNQGIGKILLQDDGSTSTITITSDTTSLNSGHVNLGNGAMEGVVCGGSAFSSWASSITTAVNALLVAVGTKPAVPQSPIDPSVVPLTVPSFPTSEISTTVKAST